MRLVILLPNTKRLKQLIKEHGEVWQITGNPEPMQCFNNDMGIAIQSIVDDINVREHSRNVRLTDIEGSYENDQR